MFSWAHKFVVFISCCLGFLCCHLVLVVFQGVTSSSQVTAVCTSQVTGCSDCLSLVTTVIHTRPTVSSISHFFTYLSVMGSDGLNVMSTWFDMRGMAEVCILLNIVTVECITIT